MDLLTHFDGVACDWSVEGPGLATDASLESAILLSLLCDRRAQEGDVLPDPQDDDPRGWWADALSEGDSTGSRLWLLDRAALTAPVLSRAEEYAREALAWLVEDEIARAVQVTASRPDLKTLALEIRVLRAEGAALLNLTIPWSA